MKQTGCWHCNKEVLHKLSTLPRKMMALHSERNIIEFVMHELCNDRCFNIKKAAYIVDNPDFDCMRGVAGFCHDERYTNGNIWECTADFTNHMKSSSFNNKVRDLKRHSCHRHNEERDDVVKELAELLGMKTYGCCNVHMRNDNHGLFLYEYDVDNEDDHQCLLDGISLLSFCPIY